MLCDTLRTIIFTKEGKHKKMKTSVLLKRFIPYYGKYKGIMVMDLFCAALTTVCELVLPLILRYITDIGMRNLASLTVKTVVTIGMLYFALRIIDGMASFLYGVYWTCYGGVY